MSVGAAKLLKVDVAKLDIMPNVGSITLNVVLLSAA